MYARVQSDRWSVWSGGVACDVKLNDYSLFTRENSAVLRQQNGKFIVSLFHFAVPGKVLLIHVKYVVAFRTRIHSVAKNQIRLSPLKVLSVAYTYSSYKIYPRRLWWLIFIMSDDYDGGLLLIWQMCLCVLFNKWKLSLICPRFQVYT